MNILMLVLSALMAHAAHGLEVGDRVLAQCGIDYDLGVIEEKLEGMYFIRFDGYAENEACGANAKSKREVFIHEEVNQLTVSSFFGLIETEFNIGDRKVIQCGYSEARATVIGLSKEGFVEIRFDDEHKDFACGGWRSTSRL